MSHLDTPCHCCGVKKVFFDDFRYTCQKCFGVHCPACFDFSEGDKCPSCVKKKVNAEKVCVVCKTTTKRHGQYEVIHSHHVNWIRFGFSKKGKTMPLCSKHHQGLHAWITNKAIQMCIDANDKFFEEHTDLFLEEVK